MLNPALAREQWVRYVYSRDTGHRLFIDKANRCEDFFAGYQWDEGTFNELRHARRPALTVNTVLNTISSILGEQIDTRNEISFKPRYGAPPMNANILTKTFRFISDQNQLDWIRSEVFADGIVTSRGYFDCRLTFDNNQAGEVLVSHLNPRTVLPDPDAWDYDPVTWNDVIVTSWVTADEIEIMYNKEDAEALRLRAESVWAHGYDSIDSGNDRFGGSIFAHMNATEDMRATMRGIRLIDRQHRQLCKMQYFVDPKSGDKMRVPDGWSRDDIAIAVQRGGLVVTSEVGKRIRWTVTAEDFVLHDDWSPFRYFTVVPYFPHLRYGRTIGIVEGLIDPQEMLNKALSQELHVVNTMANSGWKVKTGSLLNYTMEEMEEVGAKSGLILEIAGDPDKDVVKITPNQIPQGLERLSFKAENYVKLVSGRGNQVLGLPRSDESGKLTQEAEKSADKSLKKPLDNLIRTDHLLARNILDLVQHYYTDHRIMNITLSDLTGDTEEIAINMPDEATGEILNDVTLGTYDVKVVSTAVVDTLEDSQLEQAVKLRELGVMIPDEFLIENSNLLRKGDIIKQMRANQQSPQAQQAAQVQALGQQLTVAKLKGETENLEAEAVQRRAKAAETVAKTGQIANGDPSKQADAQAKAESAQQDMALDQQRHAQELQQQREKHEQDMLMAREKHQHQLAQSAADGIARRRTERAAAIISARNAARAQAQPTPSTSAPAA